MTGTPGTDLHFINEEFYADAVTPAQLDRLLADGWRHFGTHFFRYNLAVYRDEIRRVIPLRIRVADFQLSKSQRRVLRRNHVGVKFLVDEMQVSARRTSHNRNRAEPKNHSDARP